MPVTQLQVYIAKSSYNDNEIRELKNGDVLKISEGQFRHFLCTSSGSFPKADVSMWLGNTNITGMFEKNVKKITEGDPVKDEGLLKITYQVTQIYSSI